MKTQVSQQPIHIGISSCLLGQSVRFNGGHSQSRLCLQTLSDYFEFEPFCPEVAAGFGTPRPTMRLIGDPADPTLTFSGRPDQELTGQLRAGFSGKVSALGHLDGYILMKNSPSCGLERIKVYQDNGHPHEQRRQGLFTEALQQQYPLLPLEEEGRLHDPGLRENFILRVYAHHHFRHEVLAEPSLHKLLQFHSSYKYVLMAHSQQAYKGLGRMLGQTAHNQDLNTLLYEYQVQLMAALSQPADRKGHTNVLLHLLGYLKRSVAGEARQHIVDIVQRYRQGQLPLITPLTLLRHYIDQKGSGYVRMQRYLEPYPEELGLRNEL